MRPAWKQATATWRVKRGFARVNPGSVDTLTNIGLAVINMKGTDKDGLRIESQVRASPGKSNVGIVGPYKNAENQHDLQGLRSPWHTRWAWWPSGAGSASKELLMIKEQIGLNWRPAKIYKLVTERHRRKVTCALWDKGVNITTLRYRLKNKDLHAYGGGKKAGLRIRIVVGAKRRDEDDGRSRFLDFRVSTI